MHGRRDGHCSGRYASYWNAFLSLRYSDDSKKNTFTHGGNNGHGVKNITCKPTVTIEITMTTIVTGMSTYRILLRRTDVWSTGRSRQKIQRANLLVETADRRHNLPE